MSEKALPDIASMLGAAIGSVPAASQPQLLGLLEAAAAERYDQWARELPAHADALRACAAREREISATAARIFPLDAAGRAKLDAPFSGTREAYLKVLEPLSIRDQLRMQSIAERAGGNAWRGMAAAIGGASAKAALSKSAELEEANAAALDQLVAKLSS